jgi:hypothetical protein
MKVTELYDQGVTHLLKRVTLVGGFPVRESACDPLRLIEFSIVHTIGVGEGDEAQLCIIMIQPIARPIKVRFSEVAFVFEEVRYFIVYVLLFAWML